MWVQSKPQAMKRGLYHRVKDRIQQRTYCGRRYRFKGWAPVWQVVEEPVEGKRCRTCDFAWEKDGKK